MATNKNITMRQYNGVDYDTLYPKTIAAQIDDVYSKSETSNLFLPKAGGSMGGILDMNGNRITNLATPTLSTDAATKGYVDESLPYDYLSEFNIPKEIKVFVSTAGEGYIYNYLGYSIVRVNFTSSVSPSTTKEYVKKDSPSGVNVHTEISLSFVITISFGSGGELRIDTDGSIYFNKASVGQAVILVPFNCR